MSSHQVTVHRLHVEPHPNAERLLIGSIPGQSYQFIVGTDRCEGELGAYIPEASVLPDHLIEQMGIRQYLAGPEKNRVKAARLRGILSQGLWIPLRDTGLPPSLALEGDNIAEWLDVTKYEPPVPRQLQGVARARPVGPERDFWWKFDVENIKHYPDLFQYGEPVSISEKLHGTLLLCALIEGEEIISSKGLAARNLVIEESESNLYWQIATQYGLFEKLRTLGDGKNIMLFGEIVGVQDLKYGVKNGDNRFYAFDLFDGTFADPLTFRILMEEEHIPTVPLLYEGPFMSEAVEECTSGMSLLAGHIREGCVIRSLTGRMDPRIGRAILKSVSAEYLLRKGETTEYS